MNAQLPVLTPADYASSQDVRWCPGCGDYSILAQMKKMMSASGIPRTLCMPFLALAFLTTGAMFLLLPRPMAALFGALFIWVSLVAGIHAFRRSDRG